MSLRTESVTKTVTTFELKLPEPFTISPKWLIDLSASRVAEVYEITTPVKDYDVLSGNDVKVKMAPGWRVVIKTKRGTFLESNRYERPEGQVFTDALLMSLYLQKLAVDYAKKKKTTVEEIDQDD